MLNSYEAAALALNHFSYAALLACLFAAVTIAYLAALWRLAGTLGSGMNLLLHTLYLLWQTNIAFVAVVSLSVGVQQVGMAGEIMAGWRHAPFLVPAASLLYASVLLLSLLLVRGRARSRSGGGVGDE